MILPKRLWLNSNHFEVKTGIFFGIRYFREYLAYSRRIYCLKSYYKYSKNSDSFTPRQHQRNNTQLRKLGFKLVDDHLRIRAKGGVADDAELDTAAVAQDGDA
jgi:hypothetical protein